MSASAIEVLDRAVAALGGDDRPGQQNLAAAVASAIDGRHHLLAEAPTGSGKSLAYLAPVLASGRRAVVATATLALQDQLWRKDLPHLHEHAGVTFSTALVKGRSNYLCLARLDAAEGGDALFDERPGPDFAADLERLARFAADSPTGDVADLGEAVTPASWRAVTCGPNECPGRKRCGHGDECFAEVARDRAEDVDVIVVNHALYCAHLATGGQLLPEHDVVILDEAHSFDATATGALGTELSGGGLRQLAGRLRRADAPRAVADGIAETAERVDDALGELDGRVDPTDGRLADVLDTLAERLTPASKVVQTPDMSALAIQAGRLAAARLEAVRRLRDPADGEVVWVEGGERRSLQLAPVAIGGRLAPLLFAQVPTVMVSATLGAGKRFEPLARRLGLEPDAEPGVVSTSVHADDDPPDDEPDVADGAARRSRPGLGYVALHVETPFDYRTQSMLYVPRQLPDPRQPEWQAAAADELCELVGAAGGRTLVLCTSWRVVRAFTDVLRERTDHTVLTQGDEAAGRLIEQFGGDETSCLVATRAFWMGLDIPGPSCVLVVIDRLPFTRPDEPLEQARRDLAEAAGGDGFRDVDLPATALVLAQGAGRLIRRHDDHGVVAVLDRRLATSGYRSVLLDALPPMRRVVDGDVAREFLERASGSA
jgi:ATP-dependent DNA helicase DinG